MKAHSMWMIGTDILSLQELGTNHLYLYNLKEGVVVNEFKGNQSSGVNSDTDYLIIKQSQEPQELFLWYNGGANLALIDFKNNMFVQTFEDFLKKEDSVEPQALVSAIIITKPNKIIALCMSDADEYFIKTFELLKNKNKWFSLTNISNEKKTKLIESRFCLL